MNRKLSSRSSGYIRLLRRIVICSRPLHRAHGREGFAKAQCQSRSVDRHLQRAHDVIMRMMDYR